MTDDLAPIVKPARYAKNMMAVHCPSDGSGWKTRAMRLCAAVSSRWSNRENAYIMSANAANKVLKAYAVDVDVELRNKNGVLDYVFVK